MELILWCQANDLLQEDAKSLHENITTHQFSLCVDLHSTIYEGRC